MTFRKAPEKVSYKGKHINFQELGNIVFIPDTLRFERDLKSGDKLSINDIEYTIIDNRSNCDNFHEEECIEVLNDMFIDGTYEIKIIKESEK